MTQSAPQKDLQIPTVIAIIALLGISFSVGLTAMLMTAVLFLEVGGLEGGLMFMLLGSPVVGFLMGMGSLVVMGGHAAWWSGGKRPFSLKYLAVWILSWLVSLGILAFPFIFSWIGIYYWPENSLIWTIPLSLFAGLFVGANLNHRVLIKQTKAA